MRFFRQALLICTLFFTTTVAAETIRLLVVTGEFSGEQQAVWYLKKMRTEQTLDVAHGIGGKLLGDAGVTLHPELVVKNEGFFLDGLWNALTNWWHGYTKLDAIGDLVETHKLNQVLLVDCPRLNVQLAPYLRKRFPSIFIRYLAPPEIWWQAYPRWLGISALKCCDDLITPYPFAVKWYHAYGLSHARYAGSASYDRLKPYFNESTSKEKLVALAIGSRYQEVEMMLPWCQQIIDHFKKLDPDIRFILPLAPTLDRWRVEELLKRHHLSDLLEILDGGNEKFKRLTHCCLAISKPGTITLDLALLNVPTIAIIKLPWTMYWFLKWQFLIPSISLPNQILNKSLVTELIQSDCTLDTIIHHATELYQSCLSRDDRYKTMIHDFELLKKELSAA